MPLVLDSINHDYVAVKRLMIEPKGREPEEEEIVILNTINSNKSFSQWCYGTSETKLPISFFVYLVVIQIKNR